MGAVLTAAGVAAATPGTPVYTSSFSDAATADNGFLAADGKRYFDIDPGADDYGSDLYERPTVQTFEVRALPDGSERFAASEYQGYLDIVGARAGFDDRFLYVAIDLASRNLHKDDGTDDPKGIVARYGFRLSTDPNGAGGLLFRSDQPELKNDPNTVFGSQGTFGYRDQNGDVGGAGLTLTREDQPSEAGGDGFEQEIVSDGQLASGETVLFVRLDPSDATIVEFALDYAAVGLSAADLSNLTYFEFEATQGGPQDPASYLWNDAYDAAEAGSPNRATAGDLSKSEFGTQGLGNIYEVDTARGGPLLEPPTIAITSPLAGNVFPNSAAVVSGTVTGDEVAVNVDGVAADVADGAFTATVPLVVGSNTLVATASNPSGVATDSVVVEHDPTAVVLAPIGDRNLSVGSTLTLQLSAEAAQGTTLDFSVSPLPLPANATLSSTTGLFTFAPSLGQVGSVALTFSVSNGTQVDSEAITITVDGPVGGDPTAIRGRVLDANEAEQGFTVPLEGVTIRDLESGVSTTTDANGHFLLTGLTSGELQIEFDGATALSAFTFGAYRAPVEVIDGLTTVLDRPIYLPRLDGGASATVAAGQVTNLTIPEGVTITVPPDSVQNADRTLFNGTLTLALVPAEFTPGELPETLRPGLVITIQPMGLRFAQPAQVTFPNLDGWPVGVELDLWSLDHDSGRFFIAGRAQVDPGGSTATSFDGGILETSWHYMTTVPNRLAPAPACDTETTCCERADIESSVVVPCGDLIVDHTLPAYVSQDTSRALRFVHQSSRVFPNPVMPFDITVFSLSAVPGKLSYGIEVGGVEEGEPQFVDLGGFDEDLDETLRAAVSVDAALFPTGLYPYRAVDTSHFALSEISSIAVGEIAVINEGESPFGAGWTLAGADRLHDQGDGRVILEVGSGGHVIYRAEPRASVLTGWTPLSRSSLGADNWSLENANRQVRHVLGDSVSWFISPFELENDRLRFSIEVETSTDSDWWGFAVGYQSPTTLATNADRANEEFYLFAWRQLEAFEGGQLQPEGWAFGRINREHGQGSSRLKRFIEDSDFSDILVENRGPGTGWLDNTEYTFDLIFETNRIRAVVEYDDLSGHVVEELFDLTGTFLPGKFAFYNASQADVVYKLLEDPDPETFVSPDGDTATLVRNPDGTFTRTLTNQTRVHFDANGLQTRVVDRNGNETLYAYNAQNQLTSITDPVGRVTTFSYLANRLDQVTDPANRLTRFDYDSTGNLTRVTFPDDTTIQYEYDAKGLITRALDQRELPTIYEHDAVGRLERVERADGSERLLTNGDGFGLIPAGSGQGTEANPAPALRPADAVSTVTDAEGRVTEIETRALGRTVRVKDPAGLETTIERDPFGNPTRIDLPSGQSFVRTFDSRSNLLSLTDESLAGTAAFSYHPIFNRVTTMTDARGKTTTLTYDEGTGDLLTIESPMLRTTAFAYLPDGQVDVITEPFGAPIDFDYDPDGNVSQIRWGTGIEQRVTTFTHTAEGYVDTVLDAEGRTTAFDYDAFGRVTRHVLPDLREVHFGYDAAGNLTSLTPPGRPDTLFAYDNRNQESEFDPPPVTAADPRNFFSYNGENQLTRIDRPDGLAVQLDYDSAGRLDLVTRLDGAGGSQGSIDLSYDDQTGLLATVTEDTDGVVLAFGYLGERLESETWSGPVAGSVSVGFDADGRLADRDVNGAHLATFGYDDDGLLTQTGALTLGRDLATGLVTSTALGQVASALTYNAFGEVETDDTLIAITPVYEMALARDRLGRITQRVETIQGTTTTTDFTYDAAGRIDTVTESGVLVRDYEYDSNGNRLRAEPGGPVIAAYDDQDRLLQYRTTTYTYTENGELLSKTDTSTLETTTYDYDVLGNLRGVMLPDGTQITYVIDGSNRRVGRRINGSMVQGFLYGDQLNPVAELDAMGAVISRFVYGSKVNVPEYMVTGGTTYRIISDYVGSVRLVIDANTGTVAQRLDYDEFGNITNNTNPGFQPFGFAGGLYDPNTGLTRFGARDYDPVVGRWTAKDPIRFEGGDPNLYGYVLNDPVNLIDPEGLFAFAGAGAAGGSISVGAGGSGVGAALGAGAAAGAAVVGFGAAGYGIGTLIEPYVSPLIEPLIDAAANKRKGGWVCHATCNLQWQPDVCPTQDRVSGTGYGSSAAEARRNAIHDATQRAPRGSYPRHCRARCSKL